MTAHARCASTLLLGILWAGLAAAVSPYLVDGDGDAVSDEIDECPYTQPGVQVNKLGCPLRQDDGDLDGVVDDDDQCPYSAPGALVDVQGCARDQDFDGVADGIDRCPATPLAALVNAEGCAAGEAVTRAARQAPPPEVPAKVVLGPIPERPAEADTRAAAVTATAAVIAAPVLAEQPLLVLRFRANGARLGQGDLALIAAYAKVFQRRLAASPQRGVKLKAFADSRELQPIRSMAARMTAVRAALIQQGVPAEQIEVESRVLSGEDAAGNRRVELRLGE